MNPESNEHKLERALRLHRENRLDEAETLYREVLQQSPGHQTALHLSGLVAYERGRYREAVSLIEQALAGGAKTAAIYNNCGAAYRALGEFETAARHFAQALALDPEFADAHLNYALASWDLGLSRQAAVHFEFALELGADSPKAYYHLGQIYLQEEKPALAVDRLREAVRLRPEHAAAHYLLGQTLLAQGETRGARQSLIAALKLQPEHADAGRLAAKASFELCDESAALMHLDQAQRHLSLPGGEAHMHAACARLGQIERCCGDGYTRLARPQWLRLPQPKALPEEESRHFALPEPFALEIFLAHVTRVRVLPQELLLLSADGQLFLDGLVAYPRQYVLREGGAIQHCADDGRVLLLLPRHCISVEQPCAWIGAGSGHFKWMFESLARLWAVQQQPALQELPLVVQPGLSRWQDELLQLLGYGPQRRIEVPADAALECRELHAASLVSVGHFIAPVAIQYLRRALAQRVQPAADAPRRIYLSRRHMATRRLANEAELLPLLEQHGFVAVHAESMSAAEQLALFQSAEFILGVEGAALVNLLIAPAHARVGVIVARGLYQPRHYYVSAPIGHDFTYLSAEPDYASHAVLAECDVTLPREVLQAFLEQCGAT
ncbi:MAG TPA: glycosyltransferase 61 family protein [Burkholderiales bacterium]